MSTCERVVQDFGHEITVLYYNNAKKGFKFIGDDPESKVIPVDEDVRERVYNKIGITGYDDDVPARAYLDKFYLHNRCLLFTSGMWMSETAGVPQARRRRGPREARVQGPEPGAERARRARPRHQGHGPRPHIDATHRSSRRSSPRSARPSRPPRASRSRPGGSRWATRPAWS